MIQTEDMKVHLLFCLTTFFLVSNLLGQQKIKCSLMDVSDLAFHSSPTLKRAQLSIKNAESEVQIQKSIFDYNLNSGVRYQTDQYRLFNADPRNQYIDKLLRTNATDISVGLQKKTRAGQITDLKASYVFNNSNFPFNEFNENTGPYFGHHTGSLNFSLTQPLLKGRGRHITTIPQKISELYVENSVLNFEFDNSYQILQISQAYWNYYTAYKSYDVYKQNEERVRKVLEMTNDLVKANKKPASDIAQVKADLSNQERQTVLAEQNYYNARINLGRVIGLSEQESPLLDVPGNDFPTISESGYKEGISMKSFIELARKNRGDIKAIEKLMKAYQLQLELAENNLKPQLDLSGFAFYGSSTAGNGIDNAFKSFANSQGQNLGGGFKLTFTFPLNNNLAKGNYVKNTVALNDQNIANMDLQRNIDLNVNIAVKNLQNSVEILEKSNAARAFYQEAFDNEQIKFQTGLTTLLNLILFQERLTYAQLEYLNACQQFANQIVILRHETGTLVSQQEKGFTVNLEAFYTIPKVNNKI